MSNINISDCDDNKYKLKLNQSFAYLTEYDNEKNLKFEPSSSAETKSNLINNFDQSQNNSEQCLNTSCFLKLQDSDCFLCDKKIQTRLRSCDMKYMISIKNIYEGSTVLIMWNNIRKVYMVFW